MADHRKAWNRSVALHIGDATMKVREARGEPARGRRGYWAMMLNAALWGLAVAFALLALVGS